MIALVLVALFVLPLVAAKVLGIGPAIGLLLGSLLFGGVAVYALVQSAQDAFRVDQVNSDCRIVGSCSSDVIQEWCAPSPAACPSMAQINANRH